MGFSVADTSRLGDDFPDMVVGRNGFDALVEMKTYDRRKNGPRKTAEDLLSGGQREFAQMWKGSRVIAAYTAEDVLRAFHERIRHLGLMR